MKISLLSSKKCPFHNKSISGKSYNFMPTHLKSGLNHWANASKIKGIWIFSLVFIQSTGKKPWRLSLILLIKNLSKILSFFIQIRSKWILNAKMTQTLWCFIYHKSKIKEKIFSEQSMKLWSSKRNFYRLKPLKTRKENK